MFCILMLNDLSTGTCMLLRIFIGSWEAQWEPSVDLAEAAITLGEEWASIKDKSRNR
jgi:hypothetical protein